jgi:hypothetical protein
MRKLEPGRFRAFWVRASDVRRRSIDLTNEHVDE